MEITNLSGKILIDYFDLIGHHFFCDFNDILFLFGLWVNNFISEIKHLQRQLFSIDRCFRIVACNYEVKMFVNGNFSEMTGNVLKNDFVSWSFLSNFRKPTDYFFRLLADSSFIQNKNASLLN